MNPPYRDKEGREGDKQPFWAEYQCYTACRLLSIGSPRADFRGKVLDTNRAVHYRYSGLGSGLSVLGSKLAVNR